MLSKVTDSGDFVDRRQCAVGIDRLYLQTLYASASILHNELARNERHQGQSETCGNANERIGIEALYRKPNMTKRHPQCRV